MVLLQVQNNIFTHNENGFILTSLQEPVSQAEFELEGFLPENSSNIPSGHWRDFVINHNANQFDILVYTELDDDPTADINTAPLFPIPVFEKILPSNVWRDEEIELYLDVEASVKGWPVHPNQAYELFANGTEVDTDSTPKTFTTTISENTTFKLVVGEEEVEFTVKREDLSTTSTDRFVEFNGAEWDLTDLTVENKNLVLDKEDEGYATTSYAQATTIGRKTIQKVTLDCSDNVLFLFSNDNKQTWYTYDNEWFEVDLEDISLYGINKSTVESLTQEIWYDFYKAGTLDYAVYLFKDESEENPYFTSINTTFLLGDGPEITEYTLTPKVTHNDAVLVAAKLIEDTKQKVKYEITLNDLIMKEETDFKSAPYIISKELNFDLDKFNIGDNEIKISVENESGQKDSKISIVEIVNIEPQVTVLNKTSSGFKAIIGDDDGDKVRYKIYLNNEVFQDWSDWVEEGIEVNVAWNSNQVKVGENNTFKIEFEDNFSEHIINDYEYTFEGAPIGLVFMSPDGDYYSDEDGNIIKPVVLDDTISGTTTNPKEVIIKNNSAFNFTDVFLSLNPISHEDNIDHEISLNKLSEEGYTTEINLGVLGPNEQKSIFTRVSSDKTSNSNGSFNINMTAYKN